MKMTLYTVLGVAPDATEAQIAEAYARCEAGYASGARDRNAQVMAREAFNTLSNPDKRAMYDRSLVAPVRPLTQPVEIEERGFAFDWRHGLSIALAVGLLSGWWFSRAPKNAPVAAPVAEMRTTALADGPPDIEVQLDSAPSPEVSSVAPLSGEDLFAKLAPSIVRINVASGDGQGVGSGVVIGAGIVITNCHVAQGGKIQVKSGNNVYDARLALADQAHDLCRLEVAGLSAPPIEMGQSTGLRTGQKVVAIGAPHGLDLTISEGIVSSLRQVDDGTLIQTTAPVSPGSSGGGLFDLQGRLIGIVTFQVKSGQNLNFAAPSEWIGSMSATKGDGIISKLTGKKAEVKAEAVNEQEEERQMLARRWACRDAIDGFTFDINFTQGGHVEMRKKNQVMQGIWRFAGTKLEIVPYAGTVIYVESLSDEKLILYFGKGVRAVCANP